MLVKIENYSFRKKATKGKYRVYIDAFVESNEQVIAWKCSDIKEVKRCVTGFNKVVKDRNLKDLIKVRSCAEDLVIGLERVIHD